MSAGTLQIIKDCIAAGTFKASQQAIRRIQHPAVFAARYLGTNGMGDECWDLARTVGRPVHRLYLHKFARTTPAGHTHQVYVEAAPDGDLSDNAAARRCEHYYNHRCEDDFICPDGAYCHKQGR